MININNENFLSRNVRNRSTRVISEIETSKKFDEWKSEDVNNVEKIVIDSTVANVNVSVSNSSKAEAHFYGQADIEGDFKFDVCVKNQELRITLKFTHNYCDNDYLNLDVTLPQKTFKEIIANSLSANITLSEGVSTNYIKVKNKLGYFQSNATFANASITTTDGDVNLYINAKEKISMRISTVRGHVLTELNNVGYIYLSTKSISGNVANLHESTTGYTAKVDISTMSGNISIR